MLLRAIEALACDAGLSSAHILFIDEQDLAAAQEQGWMLRSTVQFHWQNRRAQTLRRLRRFPHWFAARETQEDPAGASPHRRCRRSLLSTAWSRHSMRGLGLLLLLLLQYVSCTSFDALPDARFLSERPDNHARQLGPVHCSPRWKARRLFAYSGRYPAVSRLWSILGVCRTNPLPPFRGVLLPATPLVHRARLHCFRGGCARRAQDGAWVATASNLVSTLVATPVIRERSCPIPPSRGTRHRSLCRRAGGAQSV